MEQLRQVETPAGVLTYVLQKKRVRNLNLRVDRSGTVTLSIPMRCSVQRADDFIREKSQWLFRAVRKQQEEQKPVPPAPARKECEVILLAALRRAYPLIEPLGVTMPVLKLRKMTSQWGNCHWSQGYITLNTALARCPAQLQDYVALHELVHFLHHDHGAGFYEKMDLLMPDWRQRRSELKKYSAAIER